MIKDVIVNLDRRSATQWPITQPLLRTRSVAGVVFTLEPVVPASEMSDKSRHSPLAKGGSQR
jgi:hypothetical protein